MIRPATHIVAGLFTKKFIIGYLGGIMGLCDIADIRAILERHGFRFSKSLGQNFLIEQAVPDAIADASGAHTYHNVLEVGPGIGCLTEALCKRASRVVAIELDRALLPVLDETLAPYDNVEVVHGDVLKTDLAKLCNEKFGAEPVVACANLPYYITSPAISVLLESKRFSAITVMVQKEVAERICATAGTAAYSAFSIYIQYYAKAEILFDVAPELFIPRPKVTSAVLQLKPLDVPEVQVKNEKLFFDTVKAAFGMRRKTLVNALTSNLCSGMDKTEVAEMLRALGLDEKIRGEKLTLAEFGALSDAIAQKRASGQKG